MEVSIGALFFSIFTVAFAFAAHHLLMINLCVNNGGVIRDAKQAVEEIAKLDPHPNQAATFSGHRAFASAAAFGAPALRMNQSRVSDDYRM